METEGDKAAPDTTYHCTEGAAFLSFPALNEMLSVWLSLLASCRKQLMPLLEVKLYFPNLLLQHYSCKHKQY